VISNVDPNATQVHNLIRETVWCSFPLCNSFMQDMQRLKIGGFADFHYNYARISIPNSAERMRNRKPIDVCCFLYTDESTPGPHYDDFWPAL
jgi:hypothetical protein